MPESRYSGPDTSDKLDDETWVEYYWAGTGHVIPWIMHAR